MQEEMELKMEIADEIKKIEKDANIIIDHEKSNESKKLEIIRKLNLRKKKKAQQQINQVRLEIAEELMYANRDGDSMKCNPTKEQAALDDYCNENFYDVLEDNQDCKIPVNFCGICCDNEFGSFNLEELNDCEALC